MKTTFITEEQRLETMRWYDYFIVESDEPHLYIRPDELFRVVEEEDLTDLLCEMREYREYGVGVEYEREGLLCIWCEKTTYYKDLLVEIRDKRIDYLLGE